MQAHIRSVNIKCSEINLACGMLYWSNNAVFNDLPYIIYSMQYFESDDPDLYTTKIQYILENDVTDFDLVFAEEEFDTNGGPPSVSNGEPWTLCEKSVLIREVSTFLGSFKFSFQRCCNTTESSLCRSVLNIEMSTFQGCFSTNWVLNIEMSTFQGCFSTNWVSWIYRCPHFRGALVRIGSWI